MHFPKPNNQKCYRCDTEFYGNTTMKNHQCRMPQEDPKNTCNFCKSEFKCKEEKTNHICKQHRFKTVEQQTIERRRANTECKNGAECWRAARNKCWFMHYQQLTTLPHQVQARSQSQEQGRAPAANFIRNEENQRPTLYCRYQERCFKGVNCTFKHVNPDFLQGNPPNISQ